ncbi:DUF803-domain-containing protein [Acaromyces ingoldii]|uniref:DUF803-domain-containing protein n=1 Tax=Acaromyces ingoldii TaxID=215250 RepID=A0A316YD12_9BASI|nr:DUF803-domain-containing protein [Acaromyces ingoldii]PWN87102.1 DUF803-domain-containing protein [Acaromyces ingoldii]
MDLLSAVVLAKGGDASSSRSSLIGVAISLGGNILISLALNCQKLAHLRLQEQGQAEAQTHDGAKSGDEDENEDEVEQSHRPALTSSSSSEADDETSRLLKSPSKKSAYDSLSSSSSSVSTKRNRSRSGSLTNGGHGRYPSKAKHSKRPSHTSQSQAVIENGGELGRDEEGDDEEGEGEEREEEEEGETPGPTAKFLRSKLWWLGMGLMVVGEFGNFLSYGFAPASLVAPLGAVALLSNVLISPVLLHERFLPSDIGGILLAIIGAVTVVFSSKQNDARLGPDELWDAIRTSAFIAYSIVAIVVAAVLVWCSTTRWGQRLILIDVGVCAIFGGFTVLSTKGLSSLLSRGNPFDLIRYPITYGLVIVLVSTAVAQITYLNRALQRFDSREVIPTQFVLFTISAIVGSAVLYRDFADMDPHRLINFLFGCLTTFAGVFTLTRDKARGDEGEDEEEEEEEEEEDEEEEEHFIRPQNVQVLTPGRTKSDTVVLGTTSQQQALFTSPAKEVASPRVQIAVPVSRPGATPLGPGSGQGAASAAAASTSLTSTSSMPLRSANARRSFLGVGTGSAGTGTATPIGVGAGLSAGHYLLLATTPPKPGTILTVGGMPPSGSPAGTFVGSQPQGSVPSSVSGVGGGASPSQPRKRSLSQPASARRPRRGPKAVPQDLEAQSQQSNSNRGARRTPSDEAAAASVSRPKSADLGGGG